MARSDSSIENLNASMRFVVLLGREVFLVQERTRKLTERLEEQYGRIDCFRFDGETTPLADVLDELRSYGLLAAHKLVIVDSADKFLAPGGARGSGDDDGSKSSEGTSRRRAWKRTPPSRPRRPPCSCGLSPGTWASSTS